MEKEDPLSSPTQASTDPIAQRKSGRIKMLAILAVCLAPVIASYFTYYVIKPTARTNYGELLDPAKYPTPNLGASTLDGKPIALDAYKGKWLMLQVNGGACDKPCTDKLLDMRQVRLMQGKEMDRIERVWLITDEQPLDTVVMREFDGTRMLRVKGEAVVNWLPVEAGGKASDYIYM
ncbi:MAG TPA: cytochrome C oxidase subunit I, partial [Burkholderiaceae bacterium]